MTSRLIEADKDEFDWITLLPGLGHLNMNQVKGYFKVLDNICLEPLGRDILNFKSPKAYSFFKDCKDNHKAWEAFEVFLHGTMLELIYKYSQESDNVSAMGFMQWQHKINAPTVKLLLQLVLTYGLGIYTQRVGDRNNDIIISDAGRYSFDDWFFGFNHPYYREIEYRDLQNKAIYPPQVKEQRDKNLSFSVTKTKGRNQGGDFLMEQKIKRQKMMAPKGSVDKSTWQRISRCVDAFDRIYENTSNLLDLKDDAGSRNIILGNEIIEWRAFLRHSKFLDNNDSSTVFNIYGEPISSNFLNLTEKLKQKRLEYWRQHREGVHLQKISYPLLQTFTKKADEYSDDELT
ncbi:uncharacterized protein LOC130641092 [Hydractinia symbiolongicarpus]|uniref:uncharacterized protein LOC130641092 n=1 Tax=Hydractinia symbiolongicarpus TaxID=13093 RepID=UPI00254D9AE5|nr:uncharacterized protein LOC130641092 [Hydractinia symbiolongicarpus]